MLAQAQIPEDFRSSRYIRVAEAGELADSVNVWGDVTNSGRYIVPEGTTLPDLISFSFGYNQLRGREASIDWTKTLIEVKVSRYDSRDKLVRVAFFRYRYHDPEPVEMFEFDLQNNDIVTLQTRRRPSFTDYVGVVAPVVSVVATSILLIENLRN
ncbi:MAG: hypothetical protein R3281_09585 [Balneolaceae bacterium]|nr:hypothetical protein [Balneolaceae bacterium]